MNASTVLQARIRELIERHCAWLAEKMPELARHFPPPDASSEADGRAAVPEQLVALRELAHEICGSSGTLGFAEIYQAAYDLEQVVVSLIENNEPALREETERRMRELADDLKSRITEVKPEASSLLAAR